MKASHYKATRESGVGTYAIYPADVESRLPYSIERANKQASVRACPTGLIEALVIEDNVRWKEKFVLGCGDTEYASERRNGVLVEVALTDLKGEKESLKAARERFMATTPRVKVIGRGGATRVQMVVSKNAIMAPWNEYALIQVEREKSREDERDRKKRLDEVVVAIGAMEGSYKQVAGKWDDDHETELPPDEYDYMARVEWADTTVYLRGHVALSLERAEEIVALMEARS